MAWCAAMPRLLALGSSASVCLLLAGFAHADDSPNTPREAARTASPSDRAALLVMLEARPWLRPGLAFLHRASSNLKLEHSLTGGVLTFPDLELRTTAHWEPLAPVRPWASFRLRRIDLDGLPPIENTVALGIGVASDPERRLSLIGNVGVTFQLPPMAPDASRDFGTYVGENVGVVLLFGIRVRVW